MFGLVEAKEHEISLIKDICVADRNLKAVGLIYEEKRLNEINWRGYAGMAFVFCEHYFNNRIPCVRDGYAFLYWRSG